MPSNNFTITFHHYVSGKEQVSLVDPQYLPWRHSEAWAGVPGQGTSEASRGLGGKIPLPLTSMAQ